MKVLEKFKLYVLNHHQAWPCFNFRYIDEDRQADLLGMEPFPGDGIRCEEAFVQILAASAVFSDEQLRTTVLLARLTRPRGFFYWTLRFAYESRGFRFETEDDSGAVSSEASS